MHAITAIGALHESILQRAFTDEQRKGKAMEFALAQCNKSISELMGSQAQSSGFDFTGRCIKTPNSRLALTTCILFTSFEALQGRCDSAVSHALQGRRLLQATDKPSSYDLTSMEKADLEYMRPIVERLEVQATALLDKGRRSGEEASTQSAALPTVQYPHNLDHAHNMLHSGLNSVSFFVNLLTHRVSTAGSWCCNGALTCLLFETLLICLCIYRSCASCNASNLLLDETTWRWRCRRST